MMVMVPGDAPIVEKCVGLRVSVWTCNTCARLCGVGGSDGARELARTLESAGASVAGIASSPACCLVSNCMKMAGSAGDADIAVALCCGIGARCVAEASGLPVLNPVKTLGPGYLDAGGVPRMFSPRPEEFGIPRGKEDARVKKPIRLKYKSVLIRDIREDLPCT